MDSIFNSPYIPFQAGSRKGKKRTAIEKQIRADVARHGKRFADVKKIEAVAKSAFGTPTVRAAVIVRRRSLERE